MRAIMWNGPLHGFYVNVRDAPGRFAFPALGGHEMYIQRTGQAGLSLRIFDYEGSRPWQPLPPIRIIDLEPKSTGYGPLIPIGATMIPFLRKYATEIVAAIGYITTIATALGLSRQHYVAVVLGVLSTIAVVLTKFFTVTRPAKAASVADRRPAGSV